MSVPVPTDEQILAKTREVLKSVFIPSCPRILIQVNEAMRNPNVNLGMVADLVAKDVGLTARILKIANSPIFGSRIKIDSVSLALTRLGIRNFRSAVMAGGLRECMRDQTSGLDRFWAHSENVAGITQKLAQTLCAPLIESSYLAGLFHDCGIPLMLRKFPNYIPYVELALSTDPGITEVEESAFGTNHAAAGFLMARTWYLPPAVSSSVREHHLPSSVASASADCGKLVGLVQLAERIEMKSLQESYPIFSPADQGIKSEVLAALNLEEKLLADLVKGTVNWLKGKH